MKLFSAFNTKAKKNIVEEALIKYGKEYVTIVEKSKLFYRFKVLFPIISLCAGFVILLTFYFITLVPIQNTLLNQLFRVLILILLVSIALPIINSFIDYYMDFLVITPAHIIRYNQEGMLRRDIVSINTKNIKTISIKKGGFLKSIFNEGEIIILCEGDQFGTMNVDYVSSPEKIKKTINQTIYTNS